MTQPPYGDGSGQPPWQYPRQNLLPQEVRPSRSRRSLILIAAGLVVVLAAGLIGLRIVHNRGEDTRAQYCAALKQVTRSDDLVALLGRELENGLPTFVNVRRLAPASVKSQWDELVSFASSIPTSEPDLGVAAALLTDLQTIINDANSNCGMNLKIPFS